MAIKNNTPCNYDRKSFVKTFRFSNGTIKASFVVDHSKIHEKYRDTDPMFAVS